MRTLPDLEQAFFSNRTVLLAFLRSRQVGEVAEDLLQDLWLRLPAQPPATIGNPRAYLFRMADSLVIDHVRSVTQARKRETGWAEVSGPVSFDRSEQPSAHRVLEARERARQVLALLEAQGTRAFRIFRRHRVDGVSQREVAAEMNVSVSTVEADLRRVYQALANFRREMDKE